MCHYATFFSMRALLNVCETLWKQKKEYLSGVQYREVMRRTESPDLLGDSRFCACPLRLEKPCGRVPQRRQERASPMHGGCVSVIVSVLVIVIPGIVIVTLDRPRPRLRLGLGLRQRF